MAIVKLHRSSSSLLRGTHVAVLMADGVDEREFSHLKEFFERHAATVTTLAPKPERDVVLGYSRALPVRPIPVGEDVRHALPSEFDALLIPGGPSGTVRLRLTPSAVHFVRDFGKQYRPIGAICMAPATLIEAGLVEGRRLTSWPTLKDDLSAAGADWVDELVVVDGNLVTARGPECVPAFADALLEALVKPRRGGRRE